MKCFQCGKGKMLSQMTRLRGQVKGQEVEVESEAMVCSRCGFQVLSEEQSTAYTLALTDRYRAQHGLLTSAELRSARGRLGMTQMAFAKFLRVGVASVKRWELGLIQDEAMDELIRLKTDPDRARANATEVAGRLQGSARSEVQGYLLGALRVRQSGTWDTAWPADRAALENVRRGGVELYQAG